MSKTATITSDLSDYEKNEKKRRNKEQPSSSYNKHLKNYNKGKNQIVIPQYHSQSSSGASDIGKFIVTCYIYSFYL